MLEAPDALFEAALLDPPLLDVDPDRFPLLVPTEPVVLLFKLPKPLELRFPSVLALRLPRVAAFAPGTAGVVPPMPRLAVGSVRLPVSVFCCRVLLPLAVLGSFGLNVLPANEPVFKLPPVLTPLDVTPALPAFIELVESVDTAPLGVLTIDPAEFEELKLPLESDPVLLEPATDELPVPSPLLESDPVESDPVLLPATEELPVLKLLALLESDPAPAVDPTPRPLPIVELPAVGVENSREIPPLGVPIPPLPVPWVPPTL